MASLSKNQLLNVISTHRKNELTNGCDKTPAFYYHARRFFFFSRQFTHKDVSSKNGGFPLFIFNVKRRKMEGKVEKSSTSVWESEEDSCFQFKVVATSPKRNKSSFGWRFEKNMKLARMALRTINNTINIFSYVLFSLKLSFQAKTNWRGRLIFNQRYSLKFLEVF